MWPFLVVEGEKLLESFEPLPVFLVGLVEWFDLAIGLWPPSFAEAILDVAVVQVAFESRVKVGRSAWCVLMNFEPWSVIASKIGTSESQSSQTLSNNSTLAAAELLSVSIMSKCAARRRFRRPARGHRDRSGTSPCGP